MTRCVSVLILALVLLPTAANAQELPSISPGARVRVWTSPTAEPFTGNVMRLDASTLTIAPEGGASLISLTNDSITRLDVSRGSRSRGKTALYGALIGVATGVAIGLIEGDDPQGWFSFTATDKALIYSVLTTPVGALVGVAVGPGKERWTSTTVRRNRQAGLAVAPAPSLRFTLRF